MACPRAVVLLSGGLDSAVVLYYAIRAGYECRCLTFDYGQRHTRETVSAESIAKTAGAPLTTVRLDFPWKGSSLTDRQMAMPLGRDPAGIGNGIPNTYVPARNTVFISVAASYAEAIGAERIFIGAHAEDSSGYPDCRRPYVELFDRLLEAGTKAGLEGRLRLEAPLIGKTKREIVILGKELGVPLRETWSCYAGGHAPCAVCDSCILRAKGFREAGIEDPALCA